MPLILPQQAIVFRVRANPEPRISIGLFRDQGAVAETNPHRPKHSRLFELQRRMPRVRTKQRETLIRRPLLRLRKRAVALPEARCREMSHNSRPFPSA